MSNAYRDENNVPTKIGILTTDGVTPMRMYVNPTNGVLQVTTTTAPYLGAANARRDGNDITVMIGVSTADQKTPVMAAIDGSNNLLVKSV